MTGRRLHFPEELSQDRRWARALLALLVWLVLLCQLHLHGLDIRQKAVWLDEASTYRVASQPFWELFTLTSAFHSQPPLYYLILHFLLKISSASWFLRGFSWLWMAGLLGFVLLFLDELSLLGRLVLCALFLHSPLASYLSREIRPYGMAATLLFISQVMFLRLLAAPSRRRMLAYVAFASLALYTTSFAVWTVAANGVIAAGVWLAAMLRHGLRPSLGERRQLLVAVAVTAVSYLPYLLIVLHYQSHAGSGHPTWRGAFAEATRLDHFVAQLGAFVPVAAPWSAVVFGLSLAGLVAGLGTRRPEVAVLPAVVLIHIACIHGFLFQRSFIVNRYFTLVWPIFLLTVALGADAVTRGIDRRAWLAVFAVFAWWAWSSRAPFARSLAAPVPMDGWRGVAHELRRLPGKKVVMFDVGYEGQVLQYEARDDPSLDFRLNATRGWGFGGDGHMTPEYVRATLEATQPECYFYQHTDLKGPFQSVLVPDLTRRGYLPAGSPGQKLKGYCLPR